MAIKTRPRRNQKSEVDYDRVGGMMDEYQVKYLVRAIIAINVKAQDEQKAKLKAEKVQKETLFINNVDVLDEKDEYIGIDNLTAWTEIE